MKKKLAYLILIPVLALLAGSCADPLQGGGGEVSPDRFIELTIANLHPVVQTKTDIPGEDDYNENLVRSVDCFFYPTGGTDQPAVFKALGRSAALEDDGAGHTYYKVRIFFTDSNAEDMFGATNTCEAYVICNSPIVYGNDTSVPTLKEQVAESDFSAQIRQSSFLMPAEAPATVTLTTVDDRRIATGSFNVRRSAAKVRLYFSIANLVHDELNQEWHRATGSRMEIRFANASKRGKVDGTYTVQAADRITTRYRSIDELETEELVAGKTDYTYSHDPFYSYPVSWPEEDDTSPAITFRIPWMIRDNVEWRSYLIRPNLEEKRLEANHYYRIFVDVSSLGSEDENDPVWIPEGEYVIMDWMNEGAGAGQGIVPADLTRYNYLVVDQPDVTLNNEQTASFSYISSSRLASITFTRVVYFNNQLASPEQLYDFTGDAGVRTTSTGSVTAGGQTISYDMSEPGVLTVTHSLADAFAKWTIYATLTNGDGDTQDISIVQNPSIALERRTTAGDIFVNGYFARVSDATYATSYNPWVKWYKRVGNNRYYRWDAESNLFIQINGNPNPSGAQWINYGDYYLYPQRGSETYYHCTASWDTSSNYSERVNDGYSTSTQSGSYGTILGSTLGVMETIDHHFFTTMVSVSSFNSSNDTFVANSETRHYKIGDPRVPSSTHYNGGNSWETVTNFYKYLYYSGSTEQYVAWDDPGNILIASQATEDQNILAPRLLVSSGLNANTGLTFDQAVKRGATYQEAGYPAGRWRLPTEAEIAFIVARQRDGVIPNLYATDDYFWAASGRVVYIPTSSNAAIVFSSPSNNTTYSCRYVYDLWYWGDEPAAANVYHPNGHNTAY